jgi:predicted  nucleic acid-binding Zn-ribbon protein
MLWIQQNEGDDYMALSKEDLQALEVIIEPLKKEIQDLKKEIKSLRQSQKKLEKKVDEGFADVKKSVSESADDIGRTVDVLFMAGNRTNL